MPTSSTTVSAVELSTGFADTRLDAVEMAHDLGPMERDFYLVEVTVPQGGRPGFSVFHAYGEWPEARRKLAEDLEGVDPELLWYGIDIAIWVVVSSTVTKVIDARRAVTITAPGIAPWSLAQPPESRPAGIEAANATVDWGVIESQLPSLRDVHRLKTGERCAVACRSEIVPPFESGFFAGAEFEHGSSEPDL